MKITARTKTHDPVTVEKDIPESLTGMVDTFGEDVVAKAAHRAFVASAQVYLRSKLGQPEADVQEAMAKWMPGASGRTKKSAVVKAMQTINTMTETERKELLESLRV